MRLFTLAVICATCLVVGFSIFTGCSGGSDGLFDEEATKYNAVFYPYDNDETGEDKWTQDIDVLWNIDCNGDGVFDDPEPFFDFHGYVVIDSDTTAAEFRVESYTVNLRPNHGAYFDVGTLAWYDLTAAQMPALTSTSLNPVDYNLGTPVIEPGSSVRVHVLVWSVGDKWTYASIVEAMGIVTTVQDTFFTYDAQIVLHCRYSDDETFQITTPWQPINFGDYDSCE